ncbi:hypothetical protein BT63DRAFT_412249 [Microthyrium microscopicum]|uniref:Uncharacterized protein n=1 Tax=Microthyrium microscopicum TaxID=703497 RepID=A0A6A6UJE2_9PEZI|nr:hypothetical protein BT63DRAFT_412249 [Microthyrium microscopicum]
MELPQVTEVSCTFSEGAFVHGIDGKYHSPPYNEWMKTAREFRSRSSSPIPQLEREPVEASLVTRPWVEKGRHYVPQNFDLHRSLLAVLQDYMMSYRFFDTIPLAWEFSTITSDNNINPEVKLHLALNTEHKNHIPCNIVGDFGVMSTVLPLDVESNSTN